MKQIALPLILAASLGGIALAQTVSRTAPVLLEVIGADMSGLCREEHAARARRVSEECDGKQQCSFTPETGDAAAEACARDSVVFWRCGENGEAHSMPLGRAAGQSREIRMACEQPGLAAAPPVPVAPPNIVVASTAPAAEGQEFITVTVTTPRLSEPRVQPPVRASEARVDAEMERIRNYMRPEGGIDGPLLPGAGQGTGEFMAQLRMARIQPDRISAPPLLPTERATSASAPAPVPPARIRIVQATWGGNCRLYDGNDTNRLIRACNNKAQCVFRVAERGEGEAADACARDYKIVWSCGGDPRMHAVTLPPARGQSREVKLICPE
jgi:hypothetical protein